MFHQIDIYLCDIKILVILSKKKTVEENTLLLHNYFTAYVKLRHIHKLLNVYSLGII